MSPPFPSLRNGDTIMPDHSNHGDDDDDLTRVTVATDAPDEFVPPLAIMYQEPRGIRYLLCCDTRRAVMLVAISSMFMSVFYVLAGLFAPDSVSSTYDYDDDALNEELSDLYDSYRVPKLIWESLDVFFGSCSLYGAIKFSIPATLLGVAYMIASLIIMILLSVDANQKMNDILQSYGYAGSKIPYPDYAVTTVLALFYWFPSFAFVMEVYRGIMSPETYSREDYCCMMA